MLAYFSALALAAPVSAATTAAAALPAFDYSIANPASGSWAYSPTATGSVASFRSAAGQAPQLTLTCNRTVRRVSIARPAGGAAPYLFVWSTSMNRNVPAGFNPATHLLTAELTAYDKLLDALAFSRGRIVVGPSNGTAFVAPAWPDIIRVIEDCRV